MIMHFVHSSKLLIVADVLVSIPSFLSSSLVCLNVGMCRNGL